MKTLAEDAALLIIDVQQGFDDPSWGVRNNPNAEANIELLLRLWRQTNRAVIHVKHMSREEHSPLRPGQTGNEFKQSVTPLSSEPIFEKQVNSSFIGTELEQFLRSKGLNTLVIVGLSTDHCVSTTTRMAGNLGFETILVEDATATFNRRGFDGREFSAQEIHEAALASLHEEFATVVKCVDVLNAAGATVIKGNG